MQYSVSEQLLSSRTKGVAAHVAIGGWGGGLWFSSDVATPQNRTAFVKTVIDFAEQYNIDGINFEYVCTSSHFIRLTLSLNLPAGNIRTSKA